MNEVKKQAILLHIESSSNFCSVALSEGYQLIDCIEDDKNNSHARNLLPFIDQILKQNQVTKKELSAVSISIGPGSYTGLRIGASTAKAMCYALKIPIITVSTLKSLAFAAKAISPGYKYYIPFIDARRKEVYTALFNNNLELVKDPYNIDFANNDFSFPEGSVFFGNGIDKMNAEISANKFEMLKSINFSAKNLINPAFSDYSIMNFNDTAYFVPQYLKNFQLSNN